MSFAVDHGDVLDLRVRYLAELPLRTTLRVAVPGLPGPLYLTTSRARAEALLGAGESVCTPVEYEALAVAFADGACDHERALRELSAKAQPLGHRLTLARLCAPVRRPDRHGERWTLAQLLDALGATLERVELHTEELPPADADAPLEGAA